MDLVQTIDRP